MDMTPFKLDIDELVEEFAKKEATAFSVFKDVWRSRKFSFIHEARPTAKDSAFFMQTLYDHAIGYMVDEKSFSTRLAGLYALYCLYSTQLFDRPFKIYISLKGLERIVVLIGFAKKHGVRDPASVVKKMLDGNMFLFGFVEVDEELVSKTLNDIADQQHAHLRVASEKLLSGSNIHEHVQMDLQSEVQNQGSKTRTGRTAEELKLEEVSKLANDYSIAKESVMKELKNMNVMGKIADIPEIDGAAVGSELCKIADFWKNQSELTFEKTGLKRKDKDEDDELEQQLDMLLTESDCL